MNNPINLLCPFCSLCVKDKDNKPCCSLYAERISSFDTSRCFNFTSNKALLRRQRWHIAKLIAICAGFIALLTYVIQHTQL